MDYSNNKYPNTKRNLSEFLLTIFYFFCYLVLYDVTQTFPKNYIRATPQNTEEISDQSVASRSYLIPLIIAYQTFYMKVQKN